MARSCKIPEGPHDPRYFSEKRLPWHKGSFCSTCNVWVKDPTRKKFDDLFIGSVPDRYSYPHYHNIEGKRREVTILVPVKQIAMRTRDEKGTFIKMINEIVGKVECPCCHTICRGGSLSKTKYNEEKEKTLHKIDKVGIDDVFGKPKVEPIKSKVELIKPTLPERVRLAKDNPDLNPRGRPRGSIINKEEIDYYADLIKKSKDTMFEVEYILKQEKPRLYKKVKEKLEKENEGKEDSHVT